MKKKIKSGDEVMVIAGDHKGKKGKVLQIISKKNRLIVEGINIRRHHQKPSGEQDSGGIVMREGTMHLSNVMKMSRWEEKQQKKKQVS